MALQKLSGISMTQTQIDYVNVPVEILGEYQICISEKVLVYIVYFISVIGLTVRKNNFYLRVKNQQTDQFSTGIACRTYNTYSYFFHYYSSPSSWFTLCQILVWLAKILENPLTSSPVHALLTSP